MNSSFIPPVLNCTKFPSNEQSTLIVVTTPNPSVLEPIRKIPKQPTSIRLRIDPYTPGCRSNCTPVSSSKRR